MTGSTLWKLCRKAAARGRVFCAGLALAGHLLWALPACGVSLDDILLRAAPAPGWAPAGDIYHYTPENLYNYVDGAADFFIAYDFAGLTGGQYAPAGGAGDSMNVDIYDMSSKLNAFGTFQARRNSEAPVLDIGAGATGGDDVLVFYKGRYYVEIQSFLSGGNARGISQTTAKYIAQRLPGDAKPPAEFAYFPDHERISGTQRYVRGGVLGHAFLDRGIICDYRQADGKASAFVVIFADAAEAQNSFLKYCMFLQEAGNPCTLLTAIGDQGFVSEEPHHGKIITAQLDRFIAGVYELKSIAPGRVLLTDILSRLRQGPQ